MSECPGTDALLVIGDALSWDLLGGLRHIESCEECRAEIEALRVTRVAFMETEPVTSEVLQRISLALGGAMHVDRERARVRERWRRAIDPVLAGVTAPIVLMSSGIEIASVTSVGLGFLLGAGLMVLGSAVARGVPRLGLS